MIGKAHKSALLVISDRAKLLTHMRKITSRHADQTESAILESLASIPKAFIKTETVDNYKAFANPQSLGRKLDATVHFTNPYTSQDKGTIENRIGVICRFFPKETDLQTIDNELIKTVERHINKRHLRKVDYLSLISPKEYLRQRILKTPHCCTYHLKIGSIFKIAFFEKFEL
jgi:IS30 family transposase